MKVQLNCLLVGTKEAKRKVLLHRFKRELDPEISIPTSDADVKELEHIVLHTFHVKKYTVQLNIFVDHDLNSAHWSSFRTAAYSKFHIFILCYSCIDTQSIAKLKEAYDDIFTHYTPHFATQLQQHQHHHESSNSSTTGALPSTGTLGTTSRPYVLIAGTELEKTKQQLVLDVLRWKHAELVSSSMVSSLKNHSHARATFECSTVTGENVNNLFTFAATDYVNMYDIFGTASNSASPLAMEQPSKKRSIFSKLFKMQTSFEESSEETKPSSTTPCTPVQNKDLSDLSLSVMLVLPNVPRAIELTCPLTGIPTQKQVAEKITCAYGTALPCKDAQQTIPEWEDISFEARALWQLLLTQRASLYYWSASIIAPGWNKIAVECDDAEWQKICKEQLATLQKLELKLVLVA